MRKLKSHVEDLNPKDIVIPGFSPREFLDRDHVHEILESFEKDGGQKDSILVAYREKRPWLIDGGHETEAAIKAGMRKIRAVVYEDILDEEAYSLGVRFHYLKKPLRDLELAKVFQKLMSPPFNWTVKRIVAELPITRKSEQYVYSILSLLKLDPQVQEELRQPGTLVSNPKNELTTTHAKIISELPQKDQVELAKKVTSFGVSVHDLQEMVKQKKDEMLAGVTGEDVRIIQSAVKSGKTIQDFGREAPLKSRGTMVNVVGLEFFGLLKQASPLLADITTIPCIKQELIDALENDLRTLKK